MQPIKQSIANPLINQFDSGKIPNTLKKFRIPKMEEILNTQAFYHNMNSHGILRVSQQGVQWKGSKGGRIDIQKKDIETITWTQTTRGFCLGVTAQHKNGNQYFNLIGFNERNYQSIKQLCKELLGKDVTVQQMNINGRNWGKVDINGQTLSFIVDRKPAFEVPLPEVVNAQTGREEVRIEFQVDDTQNDDRSDALVEMSFHVPNDNEDYQYDEEAEERKLPSMIIHESIAKYTEIGARAEDPVTIFTEVPVLMPRGRFEIQLYNTMIKLQGQAQDFKIRYQSVVRMFVLPRVNSPHTLVILHLDPAIRKGQTFYPYILCQFVTEHRSAIDVNLPQEEIDAKNEENKGKLAPEMQGPTYQLFVLAVKGLCGAKIIREGNFKASDQQSPAVRCAYKADDGHLYIMEKAFFYVHKPPILIPYDHVSYVEFLRQGGTVTSINVRTFDLSIVLRDGTDQVFRNISRPEWNPILNFLQEKKIKIENLHNVKQGPAGAPAVAMKLNAEEGLDPGLIDDSDEEDEDFEEGDEDEEDYEGDDSDESEGAQIIAEEGIGADDIDVPQQGKRKPQGNSKPSKKSKRDD